MSRRSICIGPVQYSIPMGPICPRFVIYTNRARIWALGSKALGPVLWFNIGTYSYPYWASWSYVVLP